MSPESRPRSSAAHGLHRPPLRVLTNTTWLDDCRVADRPVLVSRLGPQPSRIGWLRYLALWRHDAVLLNIEAKWLLILCAIRKLLPFLRCRILSVDLVLTRPRGLRDRLRFLLRRWLLQEVDRFVLYFRDTEELRRVYSIPADRVRYVPFKPNTRDRLLETKTSDEGYFLACGRSNRDYGTLCAAFRDLPYPCRLLAPWGATAEHGTHFDGAACPPNVSLVSDDGSVESWNRWIAGARAVVLPIKAEMLSPSGIGAYLVAMALGKCVIITEGPATRHILDDRMAVLVPPGDADALRSMVRRVAEDERFRESIASAGKRYALSLGGEERLRADMVRELADLLREAIPSPQRVPAGQVP